MKSKEVRSGNSQYVSFVGDFTGAILRPARVLKVILDPTTEPKYFETYKQYAGIGTILFEWVEQPTAGVVNESNYALPIFSSLRDLPVEQEVLMVFSTVSPTLVESVNKDRFYYLPPLAIWNKANHNAAPDGIYKTNNTTLPSATKTNAQVEAGSKSAFGNQLATINFQNGFVEKNIQSLAPIAGDTSLEGRWGNSIRLSSTNKQQPNPWSKSGQAGDPILILANGQTTNATSKFATTFENINQDSSSLYLTSTQKLDIDATRYSDESFTNKPSSLNQYNKSQAVLTADRIVLNAKKDNVVLTALESVHLTSNNLNLDALKTVTIDSPKINLGSSNNTYLQPVLKGDTTENLLNNMLTALQELSKACATANAGGVPIASLQAFAITIGPLIETLSTANIKSNDVYTT